MFSFSQALEISTQYLLLRTVILLEKVAGCPSINIGQTFTDLLFFFFAYSQKPGIHQ